MGALGLSWMEIEGGEEEGEKGGVPLAVVFCLGGSRPRSAERGGESAAAVVAAILGALWE